MLRWRLAWAVGLVGVGPVAGCVEDESVADGGSASTDSNPNPSTSDVGTGPSDVTSGGQGSSSGSTTSGNSEATGTASTTSVGDTTGSTDGGTTMATDTSETDEGTTSMGTTSATESGSTGTSSGSTGEVCDAFGPGTYDGCWLPDGTPDDTQCIAPSFCSPIYGVCVAHECEDVCDCPEAPEGSVATCATLDANPVLDCHLDCSDAPCPPGLSCIGKSNPTCLPVERR